MHRIACNVNVLLPVTGHRSSMCSKKIKCMSVLSTYDTYSMSIFVYSGRGFPLLLVLFFVHYEVFSSFQTRVKEMSYCI